MMTMTIIKNEKSKRFSIHDTMMVYYSTKYTEKAMISRMLLGNLPKTAKDPLPLEGNFTAAT